LLLEFVGSKKPKVFFPRSFSLIHRQVRLCGKQIIQVLGCAPNRLRLNQYWSALMFKVHQRVSPSKRGQYLSPHGSRPGLAASSLTALKLPSKHKFVTTNRATVSPSRTHAFDTHGHLLHAVTLQWEWPAVSLINSLNSSRIHKQQGSWVPWRSTDGKGFAAIRSINKRPIGQTRPVRGS